MPKMSVRRVAIYRAAAAKCVQGAPECDNLCPFCRDMVDAAIDAFTEEIKRQWDRAKSTSPQQESPQ